MSKKIETRIQEIQAQMDQIKAATTGTTELAYKDYLGQRVGLNLLIISTMLGATVKKSKKEKFEFKFDKKLPNKSELATIIEKVNQFVTDVEIPYLDGISVEVEESEEDMSIPPKATAQVEVGGCNVPVVEKWNPKKARDYIFGYDGKNAMSQAMLNSLDFIKIAGIGEELRKRSNRNRMLLIGGIAIVVVGGVCVGIAIHEHNKNDDEWTDDLNDFESEDLDDVASEDLDDAPSVSLDED